MTENVDDLRLPPAVVSKIMKESLPPGTMVSKLKEAVELWQNKKSEKLADRRKKRADKKNAANTSAAEEEADAEDVNEETATQETEERQQTSQDSPSKRLSREESTSVADAPDIEDS
ncbi:hypothetical protein WR25_17849 [Diploscapter pachys]|uniref:Uncharacterized protein n=1 Tax=Diploscapter pachys TaxID=2018661 RepID=A0A2A2JMB2_9BILA|nr:hypothetical protein WR25_17849 [Diploscapter pachys]